MNRVTTRTAIGVAAAGVLAILILLGLSSLLAGPGPAVSESPSATGVTGPSGASPASPGESPSGSPIGSAAPSAGASAIPSPTRIELPPPPTGGPAQSIEVPPPIR